MDLAPLDRHASRDLADELLKKLPQVPAALRELVTGGADGNPFYMEELVKMLIDQGAIRTGEPWSVDGDKLLSLKVPPTLTGVLQARLDGLTPQERRALQLASVIGLKFWDAALAHVEPQAAEQLPSLRRRELIVLEDAQDSVGEYAFRHQILHQVTYDTLLKRDKRSAHARTAQWLAQHAGARAQGLLATAAEHYEKAGDAANAAEFYARAAAHHAATFANEQALDCTARALALASPDDSALRWRLLATRERTLELLARRDLQLQDIEAMLALAEALPPGAEGDARRAEAAWRRCDIADRMGEWARAEREARRALQLAERAGPRTSRCARCSGSPRRLPSRATQPRGSPSPRPASSGPRRLGRWWRRAGLPMPCRCVRPSKAIRRPACGMTWRCSGTAGRQATGAAKRWR